MRLMHGEPIYIEFLKTNLNVVRVSLDKHCMPSILVLKAIGLAVSQATS